METHLCAEDEIYDQLHESMLVGPVMLPATLLSMRLFYFMITACAKSGI